jgi:hypothetical protein
MKGKCGLLDFVRFPSLAQSPFDFPWGLSNNVDCTVQYLASVYISRGHWKNFKTRTRKRSRKIVLDTAHSAQAE